MRREEITELLELFKRAKGIQDLYYDHCYTVVYGQKPGDRIDYGDLFNSMFHVKNLVGILFDDIAQYESNQEHNPALLPAFDSLKCYLNQLLVCKELLSKIASKLREKASGSFLSYPFLIYIKDTKELRQSMRTLELDGDRLQDNYEKMINAFENESSVQGTSNNAFPSHADCNESENENHSVLAEDNIYRCIKRAFDDIYGLVIKHTE